MHAGGIPIQAGAKKFGQELVRSTIPEGRLKGKFKERFAHIYDQITKLGKYDGIIFVVDEFRSWQDRHLPGTAAYAEDEEILETLAFVLPTQHLNIITIVASQGDMPQKLSGGGQGDRFIPLYASGRQEQRGFRRDRDFPLPRAAQGRCDRHQGLLRFLPEGIQVHQAGECLARLFHGDLSIPAENIRCDAAHHAERRKAQSADCTFRDPDRMAGALRWRLCSKESGSSLCQTSFARMSCCKGLNDEHYKDDFQSLQGAIDQLPDLDVSPEEREQARRVLETLFLWVMSLPDNLRDGMTALEVAEAAWLMDDAVGAEAQAEHLLTKLVQGGFPVRTEKKTRDGKEVVVYSYETSVAQDNPARVFGPLKKKAKEEMKHAGP